VEELHRLTSDLPAPLPEPAPEQRRAPRPPVRPGNVPFATQFQTQSGAETVMCEAMRTVVPRLVADGYVLEVSEPKLLILSREHRPAWTIVLAIFVFPLGLLALLHKKRSQVVVAVQSGRETTVEVAGTAPLDVRRAVYLLAEES
jgi:hypothetical protein